MRVALDRQGRTLDSLRMAGWLERMILEGRGEVAYIIGGPLGLAPEVLQRAECRRFFSRMTFLHRMMRVILLEQTYREMRIMRHEPYHR